MRTTIVRGDHTVTDQWHESHRGIELLVQSIGIPIGQTGTGDTFDTRLREKCVIAEQIVILNDMMQIRRSFASHVRQQLDDVCLQKIFERVGVDSRVLIVNDDAGMKFLQA